MTTNQRTGAQLAYDIYPAFCNVDSPTFNKWVKLTAADVHGLRRDPAFESLSPYLFCSQLRPLIDLQAREFTSTSIIPSATSTSSESSSALTGSLSDGCFSLLTMVVALLLR